MRTLYLTKKKQSNTIHNKELGMGEDKGSVVRLDALQIEYVYGPHGRDRNRIEKELNTVVVTAQNVAMEAANIALTERLVEAMGCFGASLLALRAAIEARPARTNRNKDLPRYALYAAWNGNTVEYQSEKDMAEAKQGFLSYEEPFIGWVRDRMYEYGQWGGRMYTPDMVASQEDFDAYLEASLRDKRVGEGRA
jgi:hypothetical protein